MDIRDVNNLSSQFTSSNNTFYVSLWWKAERNFNLLRNVIFESRKQLWLSDDIFNRSVQMTSEVYVKPPYYKDEKWDIGISDDFKESFDLVANLSEERKKQLWLMIDKLWISIEQYVEFLRETKLISIVLLLWKIYYVVYEIVFVNFMNIVFYKIIKIKWKKIIYLWMKIQNL